MPPKNKGSSQKPPKARTPTLIDGLTKEELTKEQMEEHIAHLREELDREREERNYFQVERDRIYEFWQNSRRELQELKVQVKNLDKDIEGDETRHQVEIKVYKQKMKHLLCEHQNTISELNADALVCAQVQQTEQEKLETELLTRMKAVKVEMEEINCENQVKELEVKHEERMTAMRDRLEKQLRETEAVYEAKVMSLQEELDTMRANEICETEDSWNNHIDALQSEHNKDLKDVSEVVKDIERILDGNEALKVQIKEMRLKQKQKEKDLIPVLQDKKHLTELLLRAEEEIADKEKKMKCSTKEKDIKEKIVGRKLNDLKKDHETLTEKLDKLLRERDELYETNSQTVQTVQQKADLKNVQLEAELKVLTGRLERTEAQLHSVLSAPSVDQTALCDLMNKTERQMNSINDTIETLQSKIDQTAKAREDLLKSFKVKLRVLGVPEEDLQAEPFESSHADNTPEQPVLWDLIQRDGSSSASRGSAAGISANAKRPNLHSGLLKKMQGAKKKGPAKTQENGDAEPEMSKEQLVENIERLKKELDKEKEERNYFQLERDRIYTFWENTQKEQLELQAEIKNLDKDIEQDEMHHQVEIKVYKDKMKFLVCEHQDMISKLSADSLVAAKARQNAQETLETELLKGMKSIKVDMEEINNENIVKELEVKHEDEMTAMRDRLEKQLSDTEAVYKAKVMSLQQELDTMRANEICETEDYWNNHIDALKSEHSKDLSDVSKVVKEIQRVMDRNELLKDQIKEMKKKQKQKENDLIPVLQEKKHLTELLSKAEEEIAEMEKMMIHSTMEKDKNEIIFEKKLIDLKKDHETLKGKLKKLQQERDELYKTHTEMIQTIQQKADLKNMQLETKLNVLSDRLEKTDAQLHSVLSAPNMDQTALCDVMNKTEGALNFSNDTIRILQNKIDQISKAQEDLLLSYKAKLRILGVPEEDLQAELFESSHADKGPDQFLDLGFALK